MRKLLLAAAVSLSVLLSGCASLERLTSPAPRFDKPYSVTADIQCGELKASADVVRSESGCWEFCFTSPPQLMGVKLTLDDKGLTASLGEFSVTAEKTGAYRVIPDIIASGLDALPTISSENITETDGVLTITGEIDGKKVTITADKATGSLISLKCPYHQLAVTFSGQSDIADTETFETEVYGVIHD